MKHKVLPASHLTDIGHQICILRIQDLELKVESMEHYLNQQSILVDTLTSVIMGTYEDNNSKDTEESNTRSLARDL